MTDPLDELCKALDEAGAEVTLSPNCESGTKTREGCTCWRCKCWRARGRVSELEAERDDLRESARSLRIERDQALSSYHTLAVANEQCTPWKLDGRCWACDVRDPDGKDVAE